MVERGASSDPAAPVGVGVLPSAFDEKDGLIIEGKEKVERMLTLMAVCREPDDGTKARGKAA